MFFIATERVAKNSQKEEEGRHAGHALDNIGNSIGLDWMDCPEQGREEGNGGLMRKNAFECRSFECCQTQEINKDAAGHMDEQVKQMIAPDIKAIPVIIQRKGEIGQPTVF